MDGMHFLFVPETLSTGTALPQLSHMAMHIDHWSQSLGFGMQRYMQVGIGD